ncbi:MAG: serine O-acetyltransferase [Polyangiales bacterium]
MKVPTLIRWIADVPRVLRGMREDVDAVVRNDPACRSRLEALVAYPGVHAVWVHRVAHDLWINGHPFTARLVSHGARFATGVEIHPGARIGRGVFIDHGMRVVLGETASIGDGCLLYKGVVLGGTTRERTVRHPQLGKNVVVGSNACILGHIEVGDGARIGSGSVVVRPVPPGATVVGVPGRISDRIGARLDHASLPDPVADLIRGLALENEHLRARLGHVERLLSIPTDNEADAEADGSSINAPPQHGG